MPALDHRILLEGRRRIESAPYGQKSRIRDELAKAWGVHPSSVYRHLKEVGYSSGRRTRSDRGKSAKITPTEVIEMAEFLLLSQRNTRKFTADIKKGKEILRKTGRISRTAARASDSTWAKLLEMSGLSKRHLAAPSLATEMDAEHPNHVHVVDASRGLLFYVDKAGRLNCEEVDDPYSKTENFIKHVSRKLLVRWVVVDYYSGAVFVTYVSSTGEAAADLVDVLHAAWSVKADPRYPFMGVPRLLYADQGPATKSKSIHNLCDRLGVQLLLHQSSKVRKDAPAAQASGAVESIMRVWEHRMESEWTYQCPTGGIEEIRAQAADFLVRFNSSPEFKVRRTRFTRSELWMDITDAQLRTPPVSLKEFRALAIGRAFTRTVDNYGRIELTTKGLEGRFFKIHNCDKWIKGEKVLVTRDPWDMGKVILTHEASGETREAFHVPTKRNGKTVAAQIIGQSAADRPEGLPSARQPRHIAAHLRVDMADRSDKATVGRSGRYKTNLGQHAQHPALENVEFMPRTGTPAIAAAPARKLSTLDVQKMAVARLGRALEAAEAQRIADEVPRRGLPEPKALDLLEALAESAGQPRKVLQMGGQS